MNTFKLAGRNLWRNKRRTLITAASVFFAVFFAMVMRSMQLGSYNIMINNVVSAYTGHIQIHKKGYWADKIINNTFKENTETEKKVAQISGVKDVVPRLESFALASYGEQTKGAAIIGTDPEKETKMTKLVDKVIKGHYLTKNDSGVLIAEKLASYLKLSVNDTIVFLGQGYHAMTAAGKYPVRGIIHMNSPDLDNKLVYMTLDQCRNLFSASNRLSSLSILLSNSDEIQTVENQIKAEINDKEYEVMSWKKMTPELNQAIESDNVSGQFMLGILYMIVGFGILGTIIMMTTERKKELGVIAAVGMKKIKLVRMLFFETLMLGIVGIIGGFILSLPIIFYYAEHPVHLSGQVAKAYASTGFDPVIGFSTHPGFMISQIIVVFAMMLIAFIYPFAKMLKINPIKSMRT